MDRFCQLAVAAAQESLTDAGLEIDDSNRDRVGFWWALASAGSAPSNSRPKSLWKGR